MIGICISGYTSSGKSTLGSAIASKLGIKHIGMSYKSDVGNDDTRLVGMLERLVSERDTAYAKEFDRKVESETRDSNFVATTRLSPWLIRNATVRVWLDCGLQERARRRAAITENKDIDSEIGTVSRIDKLTSEHFMKVYGIDMNDRSIFDIVINTEKMTLKEETEQVLLLSIGRDKDNVLGD
ncbi:MAG: cytidylate kinase family protein [Candidatus Marsarchaeota archaeon]|jgi:cytidylate kinase|nr:cytidylate kinase family protein [Candidatus Marsarchaeota archaeon]MCL5430986.1 cytidylate kinase family protein [Candidatus Marsarchaeota archaeon]